MARRKARQTAPLNIRITPEEKAAVEHAADIYGVTITDLIRGWIHDRLPVSPDPNSNVRQMPMLGAHISEVPRLPDQQSPSQPSARRCAGRASNPAHTCTQFTYEPYDQCKGCYIADADHHRERRESMDQSTAYKRRANRY